MVLHKKYNQRATLSCMLPRLCHQADTREVLRCLEKQVRVISISVSTYLRIYTPHIYVSISRWGSCTSPCSGSPPPRSSSARCSRRGAWPPRSRSCCCTWTTSSARRSGSTTSWRRRGACWWSTSCCWTRTPATRPAPRPATAA